MPPPALASLAAQVVATQQLNKLSGAQLAQLPPAVKARLLDEAVKARTLPDESLAHLGGGHVELSLRASRYPR